MNCIYIYSNFVKSSNFDRLDHVIESLNFINYIIIFFVRNQKAVNSISFEQTGDKELYNWAPMILTIKIESPDLN